MAETWIVFKTKDMSAQGWEARQLMPSGGMTDILAENWDWSGREPQIGERVREYASQGHEDGFTTHGRDGDWIVSEIQRFTSADTDQTVIICYCEYQPIEVEWEPLNLQAPSEKALQEAGT